MDEQRPGQAPLTQKSALDQAVNAFPACLQELLAEKGEHMLVGGPRVLTCARTVPRFAHFLLSGAGSLVTNLRDGRAIQSCLLGPGSIVEAYHLLGAAQVFTEVVMQVSGAALRVPFAELQKVFASSGEVKRCILMQIQECGLVANQFVACNYFHELEPRLASLLLQLAEHALSPSFHLTQEFLANMLGVRRTTLTLAAGKLQRDGLIGYSRGRIEIQDQEKLAQAACECYSVVRTIHACCRLARATSAGEQVAPRTAPVPKNRKLSTNPPTPFGTYG